MGTTYLLPQKKNYGALLLEDKKTNLSHCEKGQFLKVAAHEGKKFGVSFQIWHVALQFGESKNL